MKPSIIFCLFAVALAGCSELDHRQVAHYQDYGISDSLYGKMQRHQPLTLPDVVDLSRHNVHSSEIMAYLSYSNTNISLSDEEARDLLREKVNGDVITYLREQPNRTGGMLKTFSPEFYACGSPCDNMPAGRPSNH